MSYSYVRTKGMNVRMQMKGVRRAWYGASWKKNHRRRAASISRAFGGWVR